MTAERTGITEKINGPKVKKVTNRRDQRLGQGGGGGTQSQGCDRQTDRHCILINVDGSKTDAGSVPGQESDIAERSETSK